MSNEQAVVAYRAATMPQTWEQVWSFAQMVSKTSFCPQAFRNKPEECLAAITYGAELGLSPMQALRGIAIINGQPSAYGDTLLAICQAHPQWDGKEERIEGEDDHREAICIVRRKGEPDTEARFSVADAKLAQLWGKAGPWKMYSDRMLQMRARGFALRDAFADALRGMITPEEARDYPEPRGPDNAREINPQPTAASRRAAMQEVELVEMADADGEIHLMQPGEVEQFVRDNPGAEVLAPEPAPKPAPPAGNGGKTAKERAKEIAAALRDSPNLAALKTTYARVAADVARLPAAAQTEMAEIYDKALRKFPQPAGFPAPATAAGGSHFDDLEDQEWQDAANQRNAEHAAATAQEEMGV